jgi:hypothetical protein
VGLLRKAAEQTVDGLWTAIGNLIDLFKPEERQNLFAAPTVTMHTDQILP